MNSKQVLDMDCTKLADIVSESPFEYIPTEDEISALEWIGDRYSVSTILYNSIDENGAMQLDPLDVSDALSDDGIDRVPCLDESTALAKIVWSIGPADNR